MTPTTRYAVIRKIMGLASATDHRDGNPNVGCCYHSMCSRHYEAYVAALDKLITYVIRS